MIRKLVLPKTHYAAPILGCRLQTSRGSFGHLRPSIIGKKDEFEAS